MPRPIAHATLRQVPIDKSTLVDVPLRYAALATEHANDAANTPGIARSGIGGRVVSLVAMRMLVMVDGRQEKVEEA